MKDGDKANFQTLLEAAQNGDLALLDVRRRADQKPVAAVTAVGRDEEGNFVFSPLAIMVEGNPYELFDPPTQGGGYETEEILKEGITGEQVRDEPIRVRFRVGFAPFEPGSLRLNIGERLHLRDNDQGDIVLAESGALFGSVNYETGECEIREPLLHGSYRYHLTVEEKTKPVMKTQRREVSEGLALVADEHDLWLKFTAPNGKEALVNLSLINEERHGTMIKGTVREWARKTFNEMHGLEE